MQMVEQQNLQREHAIMMQKRVLKREQYSERSREEHFTWRGPSNQYSQPEALLVENYNRKVPAEVR